MRCCNINNINVYSHTSEKHHWDLEDVIQQLEATSLCFSVSKTLLAQDLILVLGHRVPADGIEPNPNNVTVILQLLEPKSKSEIKKFMGMVNFYPRFISGCSTIRETLFVLC